MSKELLLPDNYISFEIYRYRDDYYHEEMRGKYCVTSIGCGCCNEETTVTKDDFLKHIDDCIKHLQDMKKELNKQ